VSLQPRVVTGTGESRETKVHNMTTDLLKRIPADIEYDHEKEAPSPLKTVLVQEISRYNSLLKMMRKSLQDLQKGIKGLIVMSSELDETFTYLYDSKVPPIWQKSYPSLKSLAPWIHDLIQRIDQMRSWAEGSVPSVFWLGGFTFPTGFLTALMQIAARKNNLSIDSLTWEFVIMKDQMPSQPPEEGAYISGLYLEGAKWDFVKNCLTEPNPMELYCQMPIIYFKPVELKKKTNKDKDSCILFLHATN
jgi:dynein heavy chain